MTLRVLCTLYLSNFEPRLSHFRLEIYLPFIFLTSQPLTIFRHIITIYFHSSLLLNYSCFSFTCYRPCSGSTIDFSSSPRSLARILSYSPSCEWMLNFCILNKYFENLLYVFFRTQNVFIFVSILWKNQIDFRLMIALQINVSFPEHVFKPSK